MGGNNPDHRGHLISPRDKLVRDQLRAVLGERPAPSGLLRRRRHSKGVGAAGGAPSLDRLLFHHRVRLKVAVVAESRDGRLHLLSAWACEGDAGGWAYGE